MNVCKHIVKKHSHVNCCVQFNRTIHAGWIYAEIHSACVS